MIPLHDDTPTRRFPFVTVAIIAACVLVYLWQFVLPAPADARFVYALGFIPAVWFDGRTLPAELAMVPTVATALTSMFLHGGFMHLAGNMLYLWIFGNNVEDAMGHARFVAFYVISGIVAVAAHGLSDPASTTPLVGASGAIAGVLGAYLLLHPKARVLVLIPLGIIFWTMRLPAVVVLVGWFGLQFLQVAIGGGGNVAWWAHIGGFVAGIAMIPIFKERGVLLFDRARPRGRSGVPLVSRRRGPWG
ncbi:MAG: rhomboid family intramembrane serine protease [Alphaproteobacteria bacterium]